jgi:hypothetical protein
MKYGFCLFVTAIAFSFGAHAQTEDQTEQYLNSIFNGVGRLEDGFNASTAKTLLVRNVGPTLKVYSTRVAKCAEALLAVRVKVSRAALTVKGGGAVFSDGSKKTVDFSQTFDVGYVSPWIDIDLLGGGGKCVTKVFVMAQSAEAGKASRVEVQGKYN